MHRVGRDGLEFIDLRKHGIKEDSAVIFSFSKIDVRSHIGRQRDQFNRHLDEIIDTLVENFFHTILQNQLSYKNITYIVYLVPPPSLNVETVEYPIYDSLEDRVNITKKLNRKLEELCELREILFLKVYDDYANPDGTLNLRFSKDTVHISQNCIRPIKIKLMQLLKKSRN